ncbi:MAG: SAM-dependent chlorinase/fluorinase [Thermoanaerobaculia bacterium]|nr:SAM-dependent chlorinase/fluorinase [Thermoanaerobaculia bacterium]
MTIVTLTTDFGFQDYYAGALKGALLRHCPAIQLVDISHAIKPFDIVQAAFVVQNAYMEFPPGSIHLMGVNCVYDPQFRFLAARKDGHFFLAPDNGLLALLFEQLPETDIRELPAPAGQHFPVKQSFAEAVGHLVSGKPFEGLGSPAGPILHRISLQPVIMPGRIRGTIIQVDNFENVIINIRRDVFEKNAKGRPFSLFFKRNDPITRLCQNYCDAPVGEPLCLFNSAGFLEIAVNMGKAATLLGLKVEDVVEVVFEG